ncbi:MAG: hypothetical protein ACTSW1_03325 [Candidatus Hodarchaeales archaeon]
MIEVASFIAYFQNISFKTIVFRKGKTYILEIIGPGDHVGGIGVGIPYKKESSKPTANCFCISYPRHRDGELAAQIAQVMAKITQREVLVILGIHIPNLTESVLEEIKKFFKKWILEIAESLDHIS